MKKQLFYFLAFIFVSCVSVPKQAPELSEEIGIQLQELEHSHQQLIKVFFENERKQISDFVYEEWLPIFATNFFSQAGIEQVWQQIVTSENKQDRLEFILKTAPEIQFQTQRKYQELIEPLNQLESDLSNAIQQKYAVTNQLNNTITSYLYTAAKVDENRQRYLDRLGVAQTDTDKILAEAEMITDELVFQAEKAKEIEQRIEEYKAKLKEILSKF
ncbi:hypothetical protein [Mesonia aestuariivivens]|uniref:Lipoprotein n=1 Tax=Mesonia aestuariivivens TaxID=2796128 RepID=A0ABS6W021_9FLAO|nr:hypothetical protein [Mesonia aestuariivivens]MBW2960866.1 hypothetical protein [Mesonia aestuariivivens]